MNAGGDGGGPRAVGARPGLFQPPKAVLFHQSQLSRGPFDLDAFRLRSLTGEDSLLSQVPAALVEVQGKVGGDDEDLLGSPSLGAIWETFVFSELRKLEERDTGSWSIHTWRDRSKEIDFLIHRGGRYELYEAKWAEHPRERDAAAFQDIEAVVGAKNILRKAMVCRTRAPFPLAGGVEDGGVEQDIEPDVRLTEGGVAIADDCRQQEAQERQSEDDREQTIEAKAPLASIAAAQTRLDPPARHGQHAAHSWHAACVARARDTTVLPHPETPVMTIEFTVVGEHREDPSQFLVIGTDGQYYGYDPSREQLVAIEPDARWELIRGDDDAIAE